MGRKVVLLLELIKPSTLCDNVNGECLISINKESSMSGHIKKWNNHRREHFTLWNVHIACKFLFFIMIPNGYVAGTQPNIMTENNNKEKRTYQSLCHVTPSVAGITRIGPTSALLTQTGPYSDNAPGPQPFTLHISYSGPPRITGKKWGR